MADPNFADVALLCHFDGTNGSTTFVDSSSYAHTLTAFTSAALSTAQSKFGGASLSLPQAGGNPDGANIATELAAFALGSAWTVEAHVRHVNVATTYTTVFSLYRTSAPYPGKAEFGIDLGQLTYFNSIDYINPGSTSLVNDTWAHVAWAFDGTTLRAFLDGVLQWSNADVGLNFPSPMMCAVGYDLATGGAGLPGFIDDLRITKGVCRYTANFTAPTVPFPNEATAPIETRSETTSIFGPILALTRVSSSAISQAPAILAPSSVASLGAFDFRAFVDDLAPTLHVADLVTPDGNVRVPISSGQATTQAGQGAFCQVVIPSPADYVDDLAAATAIVLMRRGRFLDGREFDNAIARATVDSVQFAQGALNYSATISGRDASVPPAVPPFDTVDLSGIRVVFTAPSGTRVRCSPEWLLWPGQSVTYDGGGFQVAYLNYYANPTGCFIDVGQRTDAE